MILALLKAFLLESKYIACEIVSKRSLNIKIRAFREPNKMHSSDMSEITLPGFKPEFASFGNGRLTAKPGRGQSEHCVQAITSTIDQFLRKFIKLVRTN